MKMTTFICLNSLMPYNSQDWHSKLPDPPTQRAGHKWAILRFVWRIWPPCQTTKTSKLIEELKYGDKNDNFCVFWLDRFERNNSWLHVWCKEQTLISSNNSHYIAAVSFKAPGFATDCSTQLSNLWWMPNSVSSVFCSALWIEKTLSHNKGYRST